MIVWRGQCIRSRDVAVGRRDIRQYGGHNVSWSQDVGRGRRDR